MPRKIQSIPKRIAITLNVLAILVMFLVGYADHLNPISFPHLCSVGLTFPFWLIVNVLFLIFWALTRWRMLWLPVLGLVLCYGPVRRYCPFNPPAEAPHGSLKVLSYNVFMYSEWNGTAGVDNRLIQYLLHSDADIICLQEASDYGMKGMTPIQCLRKYYPYCSQIIKKGIAADCLLIASRYPIIQQDSIPIGSGGDMSMEYILDVNGRRVCVINNHLESNRLSAEDKAEFKSFVKGEMSHQEMKDESVYLINKLGVAATKRAKQAAIIHQRIQQRLDEEIPVITMGDFNDNPLSYCHRIISQDLTDCYTASGNGPGISYHRSGIYVRIDHIMCSDFFKPYGATVDSSIADSDHYPIYCWLEMRPKP